MHKQSYMLMDDFKSRFGKADFNVLDVGSRDINGSYKPLFFRCKYIGLDIQPGPNVDVTNWKDILDESFDLVISGQTFEHVEDDQALLIEMARVLKVGGYCCVIAPSKGPEHLYPEDLRRYQPQDMVNLAKSAGLKVVESQIHIGGDWDDCRLIAQKVLVKRSKKQIKEVKDNE